MKKVSYLIMLVMIAMQLTACSTVAGNYPVRQLPATQATVTGLKPEFANAPVLLTANYNGSQELSVFQYKEGWIDPQAAINKAAEEMHRNSGGMPVPTCIDMMRKMDKYKLMFLLADEDLVVYRLAAELPQDLTVNFNSAGSLIFELANGQKINDMGILVPKEFSPILNWADSRRHSSAWSRSSNQGKPDGYPNIVFVLMPRSSYNQRVMKVTARQNLSFSGAATLAFK